MKNFEHGFSIDPRFLSEDPFVVLGVDGSAGKMEIKKAKLGLVRKYHPDVNVDPYATEITKRINLAYDQLIERLENGGRIYSAPYPERDTTKSRDKGREKGRSDFDWSKVFFSSLGDSNEKFETFVAGAKENGILSEKEMGELLKTEAGKKAVREAFYKKFEASNKNDIGNEVVSFVDKLCNGFDLEREYVLTEEIKKFLKECIKNKLHFFREHPEAFSNTLFKWREKLDIDLSELLNTREFKEIVEKYGATFIVDYKRNPTPANFLSFVERHKILGVDFGYVVNNPEARVALNLRAANLLRFPTDIGKSLKEIKSWMDIGWKPGTDVQKLLGQYSSLL